MPRNGNTSTVTIKGSVVIPVATRRRLGIKPGTKVSFTDNGTDVVLHPRTAEAIKALRGCLKTGGNLTRALLAERRREREREDRGWR